MLTLGKNIFCIEELRPILRELKGIGRNLNQMTLMAHKGFVRSVELTAAVDMLAKNYAALSRLYDVTNSVVTSGGKTLHDGDL
ncbi:MAG: plasmid mobilization relaxosome protein MobC [Clostridia bacterium]|nr:plasmid mobilization relaxosome protein MobC [Clostridia bacterium]